jgi:hypothetical protein
VKCLNCVPVKKNKNNIKIEKPSNMKNTIPILVTAALLTITGATYCQCASSVDEMTNDKIVSNDLTKIGSGCQIIKNELGLHCSCLELPQAHNLKQRVDA